MDKISVDNLFRVELTSLGTRGLPNKVINMGNGNKLIWDASGYTNSNNSQQRDADKLMQQIEKDGTNNIEVIVDIGCGSGNVTQQLSKRIPHKKIYASDFDPQMISYADKNHKDDTIEYFVQDIGLPWEELDEKLKALEGKVDLVWSNRVLHWVKDKATAAKTISRLLKPGGRCYVNTTIVRDPFQYSEENRKKYENFYKVASFEKQLAMYKSDFESSGLRDVNAEALKLDWVYNSEEQFQQMMACAQEYWAILLTPPADSSPEEIKNVLKKMDEVGTPVCNFPYGTNPNNQAPENKLRVYYEQGRITGRK